MADLLHRLRQVLGNHYRVERELGYGGTAVLYLAEDLKHRRSVAVKLLKPEVAAALGAERFLREIAIAAQLTHPNILPLYDSGEGDGLVYYVMPYVEGESLRDRLNQERQLPLADALHITCGVAAALAFAHSHGLIHRDIKPENILLQAGHALVSDFGIARAIDQARGDRLTDTGLALGTPAYMSPEQATGATDLDARSDIYSLGCVLYEMLAGDPPYLGATPQAILAQKVMEPLRSLRAVRETVPPAAEAAVARALAKVPADRFPTVAQFGEALEHALTGGGLGLPAPAAHGRGPIQGLPASPTRLIGRDTDLATLVALLRKESVRLVTLVGPGGVGKSRLAVQAATEVAPQFVSGVYFVALGTMSDAALVLSSVARVLDVRDIGARPILDALGDHLRALGGPVLLVLDSFEHLVEAAADVARLLAACPALTVMITSQAPLRLSGEYEFAVAPLALPDLQQSSDPVALSACPAVALLIERAMATRADFTLTAENARAVTEICVRLDGLPLALELAAARMRIMLPSEILARLRSRLRLLTGGPRDLPARQQTLRHTIDWSYDLLSADEQTLFRRLAVFTGGCTLEAAEAVCDARGDFGTDVLDGVGSLVSKSLLIKAAGTNDEARFAMLETIHEYALEQLGAAQEAEIRRAHAAYFLVLAEEGDASLAGSDRSTWLTRFDAEHDNCRQAIEWLLVSGPAEWALRLGAALFRYWEARELLTEGRQRLAAVLSMLGARARTKERSRALFAAGVLAIEQGDYAAAQELLAESLSISEELADPWGSVVCLNALAAAALDEGDHSRALVLFEQCLKAWKALGDQQAVARTLSNLAGLATIRGEHERARSLYEQSFQIFRALGDEVGAAWSMNHQGQVAREQGDRSAALALCQQALATFRTLNDPWGIANSLIELAHLARQQGDRTRADARYRESLAIFQELGYRRGIARLLEDFACAAVMDGQPERALRLAGAAAALRSALGARLPPDERPKLERVLAQARIAVAPATAQAAWAEGGAMPLAEAIEYGLASTAT